MFYTTDNRPSIRLILPSLGLEFSDGHFIGPGASERFLSSDNINSIMKLILVSESRRSLDY